MKTYKNILKTTSLLTIMSLALASCNDWLTVLPQTQIVEENFWEDKNDLEGVRYAAYKSMASQVEKMIIWGDLRADTYKLNSLQSSDQGSRDNFRNIIQANIDTTWTYYDWSGMYTTIGYCNKVLQHGAEVLEKDKQFTASEWSQMRAEMVTMRAMSYFYLVRAFKNIPYTTKVINSDTEVEYFPQLPVLDVMDSLITDVESVAGKARNRFLDQKENKGMITNTAIYALLSDMYLWRASIRQGRSETDSTITQDMIVSDYQNCILNSELSIAKLQEQFEEEKRNNSVNNNEFITWTPQLTFNGKSIEFMYKNNVENATSGHIGLEAYRKIFVLGNSLESIFELQFNKDDGRSNGVVNSFWGSATGTHLVTTISADKKNDMRYWFSAWKNIEGKDNPADWYCMKWYNMSANISSAGTSSATIEMGGEQDEYKNWIVYRLSDVLLQNAEARACLTKLGINPDQNKVVCQHILRMLNRRWWVDLEHGGKPSKDLNTIQPYDIDYEHTGNDQYLKHVMDTRKIELIGEGKRWFDLVRYAERLSNSDDSDTGMRAIYDTFMNEAGITGYETVRNRCENLWGLYSPIYYMECKAYRAGGANITQNPVWNKSKYDR